jgi:pentatricopeptide repeat protein
MCTNVLNTAARYQDPNLATDVVRVLAGRTSKLDIHHYEALITAYIGSSDLKSALQILSIMKKAGLEPNDGTTRPIFAHISRAERLPSEAFRILQSLKREGQIIPTAAVNVVLEASITQGHLQEAFKQYKALHTICPSGPNTSTFNNLLQGCAKTSGNKDLAMFIASEMAALGIRPDVMTYDRLVLVCLMEDDYEDAFRYLDEMKRIFERSDLRIGTLHALVRRCVAAGDERAWSLLSALEGKGHSVGKLRSWAEEAWKKAPKGMVPLEGEEEELVDTRYQAGM